MDLEISSRQIHLRSLNHSVAASHARDFIYCGNNFGGSAGSYNGVLCGIITGCLSI